MVSPGALEGVLQTLVLAPWSQSRPLTKMPNNLFQLSRTLAGFLDELLVDPTSCTPVSNLTAAFSRLTVHLVAATVVQSRVLYVAGRCFSRGEVRGGPVVCEVHMVVQHGHRV